MVSKEILKEAQKIMLNQLRELDLICRKHNIKYWLDSGALLGAVRHQGFIPWDDDIDVCMLEEDYEKFVKIAKKELSKSIFLQTKETDSAYNWFPYGKLRDRNSIFLEKEFNENEISHQGINLDIFIMDIFNPRIKKFSMILKYLNVMEKIRVSNQNNRMLILKKIVLNLKLNKFYFKFTRFFLEKKVNKDSIIGYRYLFLKKHRYIDVFPLKEIEFEGYKFSCPNNTDAYLKELYGDTYMELPPEKDRVWHAKEIRLNEKCFFEKELERTGRKLYEEQ